MASDRQIGSLNCGTSHVSLKQETFCFGTDLGGLLMFLRPSGLTSVIRWQFYVKPQSYALLFQSYSF